MTFTKGDVLELNDDLANGIPERTLGVSTLNLKKVIYLDRQACATGSRMRVVIAETKYPSEPYVDVRHIPKSYGGWSSSGRPASQNKTKFYKVGEIVEVSEKAFKKMNDQPRVELTYNSETKSYQWDKAKLVVANKTLLKETGSTIFAQGATQKTTRSMRRILALRRKTK